MLAKKRLSQCPAIVVLFALLIVGCAAATRKADTWWDCANWNCEEDPLSPCCDHKGDGTLIVSSGAGSG